MQLSWSSSSWFFNPTLFKRDPDIGFFLESANKTIISSTQKTFLIRVHVVIIWKISQQGGINRNRRHKTQLYLKPNAAWKSLLLCDFINWGYALAAPCQPDCWWKYVMMFPSDLGTPQSVWVNKNWIVAELGRTDRWVQHVWVKVVFYLRFHSIITNIYTRKN